MTDAPLWKRFRLLAPLITERGLHTHGFRESLKKIIINAYGDDAIDPDEERDYLFAEAFGYIKFVPAAYQVVRVDEVSAYAAALPYEVHAYEVTDHITDQRLGLYGRLADSEGPMWTLHIINSDGVETVIENDDLMCAMALSLECPKTTENREYLRSLRAAIIGNGRRKLIPFASLYDDTPRTELRKKHRAAYAAVRQLGIKL